MSIRKFLKSVGVQSQSEIERAVREALAAGKLKGAESLPARITLTVAGADVSLTIDGTIELE